MGTVAQKLLWLFFLLRNPWLRESMLLCSMLATTQMVIKNKVLYRVQSVLFKLAEHQIIVMATSDLILLGPPGHHLSPSAWWHTCVLLVFLNVMLKLAGWWEIARCGCWFIRQKVQRLLLIVTLIVVAKLTVTGIFIFLVSEFPNVFVNALYKIILLLSHT